MLSHGDVTSDKDKEVRASNTGFGLHRPHVTPLASDTTTIVCPNSAKSGPTTSYHTMAQAVFTIEKVFAPMTQYEQALCGSCLPSIPITCL